MKETREFSLLSSAQIDVTYRGCHNAYLSDILVEAQKKSDAANGVLPLENLDANGFSPVAELRVPQRFPGYQHRLSVVMGTAVVLLTRLGNHHQA